MFCALPCKKVHVRAYVHGSLPVYMRTDSSARKYKTRKMMGHHLSTLHTAPWLELCIIMMRIIAAANVKTVRAHG